MKFWLDDGTWWKVKSLCFILGGGGMNLYTKFHDHPSNSFEIKVWTKVEDRRAGWQTKRPTPPSQNHRKRTETSHKVYKTCKIKASDVRFSYVWCNRTIQWQERSSDNLISTIVPFLSQNTLACPHCHMPLGCLATFSHRPLPCAIFSQPPWWTRPGPCHAGREKERQKNGQEREQETPHNKKNLACHFWSGAWKGQPRKLRPMLAVAMVLT